jgi:molecular chaperone DnaK (HSP70)
VRTGTEHSVDVKPSHGLTDEQVEAMIIESVDKAEEDFAARQVREAQVEADAVLTATERARKEPGYFELTEEERNAIDTAVNELLVVYHSDNHELIRAKIDQLDAATQKLAEIIINSAVGTALKGTRIDG